MHFFPPELPFFYLAEDCSLEADNFVPIAVENRFGKIRCSSTYWLTLVTRKVIMLNMGSFKMGKFNFIKN